MQSSRLVANLSGAGRAAEVRIEYQLTLEGSSEIQVELLGFADATVSEFRVDGLDTPTSLTVASGTRLIANLPVTVGPGEQVVTLAYRVENAVEEEAGALHARVPVLSVALPPVDGVTDVFAAEVSVPSEWAVSEGFPTGLRRSGENNYSVSLPVVPALVSLRARADGAWRLGLPLALDLAAALILLAFGYRGWLHLRKIAG